MTGGGPAFPLQSIGPEFPPGHAGMTLRDYFAAKAMAVFLSDFQGDGDDWPRAPTFEHHEVAALAYDMADAMLKARGSCR